MGMSIDEAIEHGKEQLEIFGGEHKEFIETAIDIMRKYQQIKQIYKEWFSDKGHTSADAYVRIGEEVEDGNDD